MDQPEPSPSPATASASISYDNDEAIHLPAPTKTARSTFISLGSEDSGLTSIRSSSSSSGYSEMYSMCDCHCEDLPVTSSTPLSAAHRHHCHSRQAHRCSKLDETDSMGISSEDKDDSGFNSSLKMIRKLKRLSDAWSKVFKTPDELIIDRLKKGREEAMKKQTYIEELLNEASSQYSIQQQAKAVLQLCCSDEDEIEAERIILLAGERYKAYHGEAERIVTDLGSSITESPIPSTEKDEQHCPATLYISDIKLKLTNDFAIQLQTVPRDHTHYFLCLLKEKRTKGIIATQIVSAQGHTSSPLLHFNDRLTLPEIPPNFNLLIEIYHTSNKEKIKSRKRILSRVLNSVKRVPTIRRHRYLSCSGAVSEDPCYRTVPSMDPIQSSFVYAGGASIERKDLLSSRGYEISESKIASILELEVYADPLYQELTCNLHMEGYLNYLYVTQWERRWFTLNDTTLSCWMYPDQKSPLCEWDISNCYKSAYSASQDKYAWEHVFIIPFEGTDNSEELLLAAHGSEEKSNWITALNSIIHCKLEWLVDQ